MCRSADRGRIVGLAISWRLRLPVVDQAPGSDSPGLTRPRCGASSSQVRPVSPMARRWAGSSAAGALAPGWVGGGAHERPSNMQMEPTRPRVLCDPVAAARGSFATLAGSTTKNINSDQITWKNELGSGGGEHRGRLRHVIERVAATGHARPAARGGSERAVLRADVSLANRGDGSILAPLKRAGWLDWACALAA